MFGFLSLSFGMDITVLKNYKHRIEGLDRKPMNQADYIEQRLKSH